MHNRSLILLFPNVLVVTIIIIIIIIIISPITVKMKFSNLGEIVEYSSKILDNKTRQFNLVASCWGREFLWFVGD